MKFATTTKKPVAKSVKPAVAKKILVRPDQVIITKSHLTKLKNDLKRAKSTPIIDTPTEVEVAAPVVETVNLLEEVLAPMTGTTGTKYNPLFASPKGRVGVRNLGGNSFRVRIQPSNGVELTLPSDWTRPENSSNRNRYSVVTSDVVNALKIAGAALLA